MEKVLKKLLKLKIRLKEDLTTHLSSKAKRTKFCTMWSGQVSLG